VVYNNGGVPIEFNDPRVKTHILYKAPEKVGTLKAYACEQATGDILLELDCDDLLMPTTIEEVKKAFADPAIGFVYSNCIHTMADLTKFPRYDASYGWTYREVEFKGNKLDEFISFPPTPESVSRIWFGPDHLRAFRRSAYQKIGGYDKNLKILDDSDLVCRMYLETKFLHIDKPLYVYRVHGNNSWLKFNQEIQQNVYRIYDKYIDRLVNRWAELHSGKIVEASNIRDFKKLDDSSVSVIRAADVFASDEFPSPLKTMKEVYRVLKPGGWLLCQVPSTDGRGAFQDPRHVNFWNENSFLYYTNKDWGKFLDTPVRFQAPRLYTTGKNDQQVCWTVAHLICLKGGYRPCGEMKI
jgi:SAM-dependent methyltransferase